jgi:hypothetical protein
MACSNRGLRRRRRKIYWEEKKNYTFNPSSLSLSHANSYQIYCLTFDK